MGSRGPVPNPNSGESKRGRNTLRRQSVTADAEPAVAIPAFIQGNPLAAEFWNRHAPALVAARRLTPLQADTLAVVCEQFAEVRQLTEIVAAEGLTIDTPRGSRANPKVRLLRDARRDLLASARGFGLDAASDARLPAEPPPPTLSVIDRFRAIRDSARVSPDDPDLTPEQRHTLRFGTAAEKQAVIEDVREDRRMFA
jgi:P27 family predicted phage terminase small subunit